MALVKKNSSSTRMVIIGVVIIAVLGIGYLLFKQFFLNSNSANTNANGTSQTRKVITNFGESILNDSRFNTLHSYDVSINADANTDGGQINPFQ